MQDLFQPFRQLGTEPTRRGEGHGLGLAIVRAIADAHGASLTARARPGGGLDIAVAFPLLPRCRQAHVRDVIAQLTNRAVHPTAAKAENRTRSLQWSTGIVWPVTGLSHSARSQCLASGRWTQACAGYPEQSVRPHTPAGHRVVEWSLIASSAVQCSLVLGRLAAALG